MSLMSHLMTLYLFMIINWHCLTLVTDRLYKPACTNVLDIFAQYNLIFNYHFLCLLLSVNLLGIVLNPTQGE